MPDTTKKRKKALVLDESGRGYSSLVKDAIRTAGDAYVILPDVVHPTVSAVRRANPDVVFIVLHDSELSVLEDGLLSKLRPSAGLGLISGLVEDYPIEVMVPRERFVIHRAGISPLETLALLLSDTAGIWELDHPMLVDPALPQYMHNLAAYWKNHRLFTYGEAAIQLYNFIEKILSPTWPSTIETKDSEEDSVLDMYARLCFKTGLALASLTIGEFTVSLTTVADFEECAEKLNGFVTRTGLHQKPSVLGRAISYLEKRWRRDIPNYSKKRRNEMPEFARLEKFPSQMPYIRGIAPAKIAEHLFQAIQYIEFERDWEPGRSTGVTLTFKWR